MTPLDRAIAAVGSKDELASRLGLYRQIIDNWRKRGVPPARWPAIAHVSGLPLNELAPPDIHWHRDAAGNIVGIVTPLPASDEAA